MTETRQVARRRGTTAQIAAFTGAAGEIVVDTDKQVVVVMDGQTPGGHPAAREDHTHGVADITDLRRYVTYRLAGAAEVGQGATEWRLAEAGTIVALDAWAGGEPLGADLVVALMVDGAQVATVTIPAGAKLGETPDLAIAAAAGAMLRFDVVQVGSDQPGADLAVRAHLKPN